MIERRLLKAPPTVGKSKERTGIRFAPVERHCTNDHSGLPNNPLTQQDPVPGTLDLIEIEIATGFGGRVGLAARRSISIRQWTVFSCRGIRLGCEVTGLGGYGAWG